MSRLKPDMPMTPCSPRSTRRAQAVSMGSSFMPSSSWPANLVDQVSTLLADALVKDMRQNPISEWKAHQLPS